VRLKKKTNSKFLKGKKGGVGLTQAEHKIVTSTKERGVEPVEEKRPGERTISRCIAGGRKGESRTRTPKTREKGGESHSSRLNDIPKIVEKMMMER